MKLFEWLIKQFIEFNRKYRRWQRAVLVLSGIVVFVTTYAMILPAITLDKQRASREPGIKTLFSDGGEEAESGNNGSDEGTEEDDPGPAQEEDADIDSGKDTEENEEAKDSGISNDDNDTDNSEEAEAVDNGGNDFETDEDVNDSDEEGSSYGEGDETGTNDTEETAAEEKAGADVTIPEDKLITEDTELMYSDEKETYKVYANFGRSAQLPVGVQLQVEEITEEDDPKAYKEYYDKALAEVQEKYDEYTKMSFAKFYDISFLYEGVEVEPQGEVKVRIEYKTAVEVEENMEVEAIHFAKDEKNGEEQKPEILESEKKGTAQAVKSVEFAAEQFSVYGILGTEMIEASVLTKDGHNYKVIVTCDRDADVPVNAKLEVREILPEEAGEAGAYDIYVAKIEHALGFTEGSASFLRLFDIRIVDENGNKITIAAPVNVQIELADLNDCEGTVANMQVVHFVAENEGTGQGDAVLSAEAADASAPEILQDIDITGDTVSFTANGFSAYAIVDGPEPYVANWHKISTVDELIDRSVNGVYLGNPLGYYYMNSLVADSKRSGIGKTKPAQSTPHSEAAPYYFERVEGTTDKVYVYCYDNNGVKQYVQNRNNNSLYFTTSESSRTAFSIEIGDDGTFMLHNGQWYWNMQGGVNGNRFCSWNDPADANNKIEMWYKDPIDPDPYGLDGKSYGLMNWLGGVAGKAMMAEESGNGLEAKPLTVMSTLEYDSQMFVPNEGTISMWTFHYVTEDEYRISAVVDGSTKYLKMDENGLSLVSDENEASSIQVIPGTGVHEKEVCLKAGDATLIYSGDVNTGFVVGESVGNEWLRLVDESELSDEYVRTYTATKVSVSDPGITNGSRVIVYTRVWNEDDKRYEYYAINSQGGLTQVFESGDTIEWVGKEMDELAWDFVTYYWEGSTEENYYYELYNEYAQKYLAPQTKDGQILSSDTIGINLNGRKNGNYYTTIQAWDEEHYAFRGLKVENGQIISNPRTNLTDFYFAEIREPNIDDQLTQVPTVDNSQYGITMKLVNFGTRAEMSNFIGNDTGGLTTNVVKGLLSTNLGDNGYPTTKAGNSLASWFESSEAQEVNHLFLQDTYNGTGYFEYDSAQNFASLDGQDFKVYKEIGTYDAIDRYTLKHGQFFPYNDLKAGTFAVVNGKNLYTTTGELLSDGNPRKYEQLYRIEHDGEKADCFFGMSVEASFEQTPNGLDDWGHDIIFEFTGDDDFWLYVDGELIIDLGGIHSAVPGSVNFSTGQVNVNGRWTTLRDLFYNNYKGRGHSDAEAQAYVDELFEQNDAGQWIFKANTSHTMNIFYLERGAGASNLHMRFNLSSIKQGTVQLTKELSGVENTESVTAEFAYQVWYREENDAYAQLLPKLNNKGEPNVLYKDSVQAVPFLDEWSPAEGLTYQNVFLLKPGETAEINFPKEYNVYDYKIVECGVNTDVYSGVTVNGTANEGTDTAIPNRKDYAVDFKKPDDRPTVKYDNTVDPDALRMLSITKKLYREDGTTPIHYDENNNTTFTFRLYLATENEELELVNMYTYHVKDPVGHYCYWHAGEQKFVPIDKTDYEDLTDDEKEACSFTTSVYGTISKIPVDYTVEVRDLLAGNKFMVEERQIEIPDGYSFQKYVYEGQEYEEAVQDAIVSKKESPDEPHVDICNIKGWGLRVNKVWSDADYMEERNPAYFAVYIRTTAAGGSGQDNVDGLVLIPGTVRELKFTQKPQSLYWYFQSLGDYTYEQYEIREVELTEPITVDSEGFVTGYGDIEPKANGQTIAVDGKQKGESETSEFEYTVLYERNSEPPHDNVRVDTVTNNRPGIVIKKQDWNGNALTGAVFTLTDSEGEEIGTFTSHGDDGLITVAFLRDNVQYTLTERDTPSGYFGLQEPMRITLNNHVISVTYNDPMYDGETDPTKLPYIVDNASETPTLTIKNRPNEFEAIKIDAGSEEPLENAQFALHREITVGGITDFDRNPMPGYETLKTDENGKIPKLDNTLPPGKYQLREKNPPAGYQVLSSHTVFNVSKTGKIELLETHPDNVTIDETVESDGTISYVLTIPNSSRRAVSIWKTNEAYDTITTGASFELYKAEDYDDASDKPMSGRDPYQSGRTGTKGILSLGDLEVGEYRLVETSPPEGYSALDSAVKITVTSSEVYATQGEQQSLVVREGDPYWVEGQSPDTWQIRVPNNPGFEMPSTGGTGSFPYTLGGILLIMIYVIVNLLKNQLL